MSESSPDLEDMDDNDDYNAEQYFDGGADNDLEVETLDNIFAAPPQNPQYGLKRRAGNIGRLFGKVYHPSPLLHTRTKIFNSKESLTNIAMSSSSTTTVRAGSGEPPAKRQKTFAYGYIVWLGALDRNGGSEIVAVVHKVKLREVYSGSLNSVKARQSSDLPGNMEIERIELKYHADIVRLFAHWVQERDIKSALDSCQHERRFEIPFLCEMLEFYSKESLSNEFHDCSIDNFIDLMRDARTRRTI
ncbi:unnamed protein product [Aureobasidium pullulans]|nr:unnamed protein product [Aureobasidium pullulans]